MSGANTVLQFVAVEGTSATSAAHISVVGDMLAYTASGGVVVSTLGPDKQIVNQRFFVANTHKESHDSGYAAFADYSMDTEVRRDVFGYPKNSTHTHGNDNADSSIGETEGSKLKDRVRSVSCVALSPNKRVLAVGETGYLPRILLYSLAPNSSQHPFAILQEHSFGVKQIVFSPDSRYFSSLGDYNDGYLNVWKLTGSSVQLRYANKCTSIVGDMVWHDDGTTTYNIITAGLRSVKVWSFEPIENGPGNKVSALPGRNVVLGKYLDFHFLEMVLLNANQIILNGGNTLFILENLHALKPVAQSPLGFSGLCPNLESQTLWYFDSTSLAQKLDLSSLHEVSVNLPSAPTSPLKLAKKMSLLNLTDPLHMKTFRLDEDHIVTLKGPHKICLLRLKHDEFIPVLELSSSPISSAEATTSGEILMLRKDGQVHLVSSDGKINKLCDFDLSFDPNITNELSGVAKNEEYLFVGDKLGNIISKNLSNQEVDFEIKAHSSSVNEIQYFEIDGVSLLCTISRDRMIQIFHRSSENWELMRTLPTHSANLVSVRYSQPHLFVSSADRSISVHEIVKDEQALEDGEPFSVYQKRMITLKSTPLSMEVVGSELIVSCSDKSLYIYDAINLTLKRTLKLYTEKTDISLCVEKFSLLPYNLLAVAASDKSIRVFHFDSGRHVCLSWGHSDSVVAMFQINDALYTSGLDGCLFRWQLQSDRLSLPSSPKSVTQSDSNARDSELSPVQAKVARKILPATVPTPSNSPRKTSLNKSQENVIADPDSPTPRLTSATLKRLEAKKKLQGIENTTKLSPTKAFSSTTSPFRATPPPRSSVQSRSASPAKVTSPSKSLSNGHSQTSRTAKSLAPTFKSNSETALERATAYLTLIKSSALKDAYSLEDKTILRKELLLLLNVLGGDDSQLGYDKLLETYSTKLVDLFEQKMNAKSRELVNNDS